MIDSKDQKILSILRRDARTPLTKIAELTQIPLSTVFDRIKRLEQSTISKHTTLIDFARAGHLFTVNFIIDAIDEKLLLSFLSKNPYINTVLRLTSGFLVECVFQTMRDLHSFTLDLHQNGAQKIEEHHVLERIKHEEFMTDPKS